MTTTAPAGVKAVPTWRGGFGRLWTAAVVSRFGDSLRTAALPLLAASLTDDPLLIASVTACGFLPWLLFGLLGGAVADRVDQRRAMWVVDLVRGGLMAAFAVAVALGHAGIALLLVLAFALTTLQTLFDNAATALLPALVPTEALAAANARLMTGQQFAGGLLAAPVVPALLLAGPAVPYAADAATYVLAGYAATITGFAVGGVAGGFLARRIAERTGRVRAVFLAGTVQTGCLVLLGTVPVLGVSIGAMAVFGFMGTVWNVQQTTLMQERAPEGMLGRIAAAFRTLAVAGAPLGALLGGAAAAGWGPHTPALLAAALFALAVASLAPLIN
ncbi:MFS transporter [Streptomyces zaomyceticus]|uniref:MFS transporter n=1 Tax=Streptomyces zaomyceticus TaxID=68286 RepID=UPI0033B7BE5B